MKRWTRQLESMDTTKLEEELAYRTRNYDKTKWAIADLTDKVKNDPWNPTEPLHPKDKFDLTHLVAPSWDPQNDYNKINLKNLKEEALGDLDSYIT